MSKFKPIAGAIIIFGFLYVIVLDAVKKRPVEELWLSGEYLYLEALLVLLSIMVAVSVAGIAIYWVFEFLLTGE